MRILEYGNINNPTIMLVHGFESPYQIWIDYIEHYKKTIIFLYQFCQDMMCRKSLNSFPLMILQRK